ncbi:uncharacterized protein PpBr36_09307 [Pyricularia pennisetigena]|uniref:uncharacterized protein n=1 Tax=Pyricularia pennisetigena TaxID=1578925 RepID=UPI001150D005|nr:uncharacterized protein PpBr36_09307 [Pyricularia pennisetigena]TLS21802.1 hypothetical protein PpBr36_09307 [Pyricularia pennisetigena]
MAWNSAAMPIQGFTVFQPAPGAVLSFVPAMGTAELDQLIDAYVVQAATIQEKRAIVSMEFFTHNALTNQTHLFFPVNNPFNYISAVTGSPASSLGDSGYGSSFNVSPVAQETLTPVSSAPPTPVTALQPTTTAQRKNRVSKSRAKTTKKSASTASRAFAHDFTGMPGMQILTKDGVDVTNSARGGKTKEDREHAHLIRLLKSCPTCKKKKIRCDPSHKRDIPSKSAVAEAQPAVKSRTVAVPSPAPSQNSIDAAQARTAVEIVQPADDFMESLDFDFGLDVTDIDNFLNFGADATGPMDFNFLMDEQALFTPATPSTASPVPGNYANFTPAQNCMTSNAVNVGGDQPAQLPYLLSEGHADNYVDFTLFSPAASPLGEEPRELRSAHPSPSEGELQQSKSPRQRESGVPERTRSAPGVVGRARSPLSPVLSQHAVSSANFFSVGPEIGHNLVDSAAATVRVNPADGGTRHGGTDHGGSGLGGTGHAGSGYGGGEFAGGAGVIPQGLGLPLDRIKPRQSGASTDGVRSSTTIATAGQSQSLSTQLQRVVEASAVLQLQQQQEQQQTTPHDKKSWYGSSSSSGSSLDIRSTTSKTVPTTEQIPRTSNVTTLGEAAAQMGAAGKFRTHSAPLSSRNRHIAETELQNRIEMSIYAPVTDAQVAYSSGVPGAKHHRRCEDSAQQTGAEGGRVHQHASITATSGPLANAGLAGMAQSQDRRPTSCPPPHALCTSQNAVVSSSGLDKIEGSVAAKTQISSIMKPVAKMAKTTTMSSTTNAIMALGKPRTAAVSLQDSVSSLLLVVGAVLVFAAIFQNLHYTSRSIAKLALSISPLVLRHMIPALPSQSSPSLLLSSVRKVASTHLRRPAGLCVLG